MVHAVLICSDGPREAVYEAVGTIEELVTLACDCGCSLEVVGWPDEAGDSERDAELDLSPLAP